MEDDIDIPIEAPFAANFPLPFRALFLIGTGLLGWAANLHCLHILGVDAATALDLRIHPFLLHAETRVVPDTLAASHVVYRLCAAYAAWCLFGWAIFRLLTHGELANVDSYKFVPAVSMLVVLMLAISPFNVFEKRLRDQFLHAIRRCLWSPANAPIYFSDVLLADVFTSFAKVIGDLWLSFCMLMPEGSLLVFPPQEGWTRIMVPMLLSIPYLVRFRQCILEYMQPTNRSKKPFYNALKYITSFPVIFLSAAQRVPLPVSDLMKAETEIEDNLWSHEHPLFRLWLLSVVINSLYSFWWDVTMDWGFDFLRTKGQTRYTLSRLLILPGPHPFDQSAEGVVSSHTQSSNAGHGTNDMTGRDSEVKPSHIVPSRPYPWGLRPVLLFPLPVYPLGLFVNLVLRLTWSLKLSAHLHAHASGAMLFFWVELAELVRRWVWVFFRIEWEIVCRGLERAEDAPEMTEL